MLVAIGHLSRLGMPFDGPPEAVSKFLKEALEADPMVQSAAVSAIAGIVGGGFLDRLPPTAVNDLWRRLSHLKQTTNDDLVKMELRDLAAFLSTPPT
jgi:hypothetical protein